MILQFFGKRDIFLSVFLSLLFHPNFIIKSGFILYRSFYARNRNLFSSQKKPKSTKIGGCKVR